MEDPHGQTSPIPRRRRRRRRRGWRRWLPPELLLLLACCLAGLIYITVPVLSYLRQPPPADSLRLSPAAELAPEVRLRTMQTFTVAWFFFVGASIGSFLNVVIYRSPRGKTLLGPSRCPRCRQKIRARHNIPVFGWLALRGRCYDCRLPIAVRYPLVEATVGGIFLSLAAAELFTGGASLPVRPPNYYSGIAMIIFDPQWDLIRIFAIHAALVSVLLSWGLIQYDGQRIPRAYLLFISLGLITIVSLWPAAHPVPWNYLAPLRANVPQRFSGLFSVYAGALVGALAGLQLGINERRSGLNPSAVEPLAERTWAMAVVGMAVGWQAVAGIALLTSVVRAVQYRLTPAAGHRRAGLLATTFGVWLGLLAWRLLGQWWLWPGPGATPLHHALGLAVAVSIVWLATRLPSRTGQAQDAMTGAARSPDTQERVEPDESAADHGGPDSARASEDLINLPSGQ